VGHHDCEVVTAEALLLASSALEDDEPDEPEPLEADPVEDSLVDGELALVDVSVPVEVPDVVPEDSELLEVDVEDAFEAADFFAAARFAAAVFFAAASLVEEEGVGVFATRAVADVVVVLVESAGSCPEAS
jgi:hypothetical protein